LIPQPAISRILQRQIPGLLVLPNMALVVHHYSIHDHEGE